jgi:hypothetical protein
MARVRASVRHCRLRLHVFAEAAAAQKSPPLFWGRNFSSLCASKKTRREPRERQRPCECFGVFADLDGTRILSFVSLLEEKERERKEERKRALTHKQAAYLTRKSFGIFHSIVIYTTISKRTVRPREIGTGGKRVTSNYDNEAIEAQTLFSTA